MRRNAIRLQSRVVSSEAEPKGVTSSVPETDTGGATLRDAPKQRWPRSRVQQLASRLVLALGGLATGLLLALLLACYINDRAIEDSRGTAVAEVLDVSFSRTVVRFTTDDGRVIIPPGGVLYPAGLQEGQLVRVEYDKDNPDLVRVAGRDMSVAVLPVFSAIGAVWLVVLPAYWLLRRAASRSAAPAGPTLRRSS